MVEKVTCEKPSPFPLTMREFVTPNVMHLPSFHLFAKKIVTALVKRMQIYRQKRQQNSNLGFRRNIILFVV